MNVPLSTFKSQKEGDSYTVSRGPINDDTKTSMVYAGVIFRNGLKVTGGDVDLLSVGFCGPSEVETAKFLVTVNVTSPYWVDAPFPGFFWPLGPTVKLISRTFNCRSYKRRSGTRTYGTFQGSIVATKGNIFQVKFAKPVRIPEDTWISIEFELKGTSKTQRLKEIKDKYAQHVVETSKGSRTFVFLAGSHQMPEVCFRPA